MRVFTYYCEPVSRADADAMDTQLQLAEEYRLQLTALERAHRARERALDRSTPEVGALLAIVDALEHTLATVCPDGPACPDPACVQARAEAVQRLRDEHTRQRPLLRAARAARKTDPVFVAQRTAIQDQRGAAIREARAVISAKGLAWGTYLLVEEAHDQACRTTPPYQDVTYHPRWGVGAIAVQIQATRPIACPAAIGGADQRLRISAAMHVRGRREGGFGPVLEGDERGGIVRPRRLRVASLRTGSTEKRAPIWTNFHILMHRPLPADGTIKGVRVHRTLIGCRARWNIQFIVDEPVRMAPSLPEAPRYVGINTGWRRVPGGMRIAVAANTDGQARELVLPDTVLRRAGKSAELRSLRDGETNRIRGLLASWRMTLPEDHWFRIETETIHAWRRSGRIVLLHRRWASARIAGDEALFAIVAAWIAQDRHLLDWETFNLRRMRQQIRGRYEAWVAMICRDHDVIAIEDINLTTLKASMPAPYLQDIAHERGAIIAVGELRMRLKAMPKTRGLQVVEVPAAFISADCSACRTRRWAKPEERTADLLQTCPACGLTEDQDLTAAKNVLARGLALLRDGDPLAPTAKEKAKTLRRTRKRAKPEALTEMEVTPGIGE